MPQRVRIRDIAELAGVSPATVSRYLNNRPGTMSEDTRKRIAQVIEQTGYRPSAVARNLRLERTCVLGVVLADIENPYSASMLEALDAEAAARGYSVMTTISDNDPARETAGITRLVDARVDGLVINTCGGNDELIARMATLCPVVLLDRAIDQARTPTIDLVTSNNAELVRDLIDEVMRAGAASCVLITEHADTSSTRRERERIFREELSRRALPGRVMSVSPSGSDTPANLCCALPAPTGLIAVNGLVFLQLAELLSEDAARATLPPVATFDDYPWNRVLFGGVTTAVQDTAQIASCVVERLVARIEQGNNANPGIRPSRIEIPGTITRRASTDPARIAAL